MNDLQIEYFLASARNLSFSKAAQEMYVSQPAVSRQIQMLEEELGCLLFVRQNKGIALTANGKMFYDFFDDYHVQLNELKLRARLSMEQKTKVVRFGILTNSNISHIVEPLLSEFHVKYPDVKIEINSYEPRKASDAIQSGKEDVTLTIDPKLQHVDGIRTENVGDIPRVLIYNKKQHTEIKQPTPEDFKNEAFLTVLDEEFDYVTDMIRSFCRPYGFVPKIQLVRSTDAMILGVQCGLGVAISDVWCRALDNPDFGFVVLDSFHPVSIVYREQADPMVLDFIRILKKYITTKK